MSRRLSPSQRTYVPAETRLLSEWIAKFHRDDQVLIHVYVGSIPLEQLGKKLTQAEIQMLGVRRRWVDAIIIYPDHVELIEAKIITTPDVWAQLIHYISLFPGTPELAQYSRLPVEGVVLTAISDPTITALMRQHGIKEIVWTPDWIQGYLETKGQKYRIARPVTK